MAEKIQVQIRIRIPPRFWTLVMAEAVVMVGLILFLALGGRALTSAAFRAIAAVMVLTSVVCAALILQSLQAAVKAARSSTAPPPDKTTTPPDIPNLIR